jgi:hypothetical protein
VERAHSEDQREVSEERRGHAEEARVWAEAARAGAEGAREARDDARQALASTKALLQKMEHNRIKAAAVIERVIATAKALSIADNEQRSAIEEKKLLDAISHALTGDERLKTK